MGKKTQVNPAPTANVSWDQRPTLRATFIPRVIPARFDLDSARSVRFEPNATSELEPADIKPHYSQISGAVYLLEKIHSTGRRHLEHLTAHPTAVSLRCQAASELIPQLRAALRLNAVAFRAAPNRDSF